MKGDVKRNGKGTGTVDGAEMETEWEERTGDGAEREM